MKTVAKFTFEFMFNWFQQRLLGKNKTFVFESLKKKKEEKKRGITDVAPATLKNRAGKCFMYLPIVPNNYLTIPLIRHQNLSYSLKIEYLSDTVWLVSPRQFPS